MHFLMLIVLNTLVYIISCIQDYSDEHSSTHWFSSILFIILLPCMIGLSYLLWYNSMNLVWNQSTYSRIKHKYEDYHLKPNDTSDSGSVLNRVWQNVIRRLGYGMRRQRLFRPQEVETAELRSVVEFKKLFEGVRVKKLGVNQQKVNGASNS